MRYLLDTHVLFWAMSSEEKLSENVLKTINNPENEIFFSSASVWEVVIKHGKDPSKMPVTGEEFAEGCLQAGFIPLSVENDHVIAVSTLQRRSGEPPHNDPFDRVLIAQAKTENMILLTHDSLLGGYGESCVTEI